MSLILEFQKNPEQGTLAVFDGFLAITRLPDLRLQEVHSQHAIFIELRSNIGHPAAAAAVNIDRAPRRQNNQANYQGDQQFDQRQAALPHHRCRCTTCEKSGSRRKTHVHSVTMKYIQRTPLVSPAGSTLAGHVCDMLLVLALSSSALVLVLSVASVHISQMSMTRASFVESV